MHVIADSSLTIRRIVTRILVGLDVPAESIVGAPSVPDLSRLLDGELPKLLVVDWDLPGGDALEAVARLRALASGNGAAVLLITTRSLSVDMEKAATVGVSDVVLRPFTPHLLREKLGSLLGKPVI